MKTSPLLFHPSVIFLLGWAIWFMLFSNTPLSTDTNFYLQHQAINVLIKLNIYFVLGIMISLFLFKKKSPLNISNIHFKNIIQPLYIIILVAFIADTLQGIDFFNSANGASGLAEARLNLRTQESIFGSQISGTVFVLFKLSCFPLFILFLSKKIKVSHPLLFYISIIIAIYPLINLVIFGKRAFMMMTLSIYIWYFFYFRLYKNKQIILTGLVAALFLFSISYISFTARTGGTQQSLLDSATATYSYAATVRPTDEFISEIQTAIETESPLTGAYLSYLNFVQYYTHGIFEFFGFYDYNKDKPRTNGTRLFSMPYKVLDLLGIIEIDNYTIKNAYSIEAKPWVFSSFFGSVYMDFGEKTIYAMLFLGLVFGMVYRKACANIFLFPLYAIMSNFVLFFPVTDFIYNTQGWHYMLLATLFYFFMKIYSSPKTK